jgi:signal transduction histidine kinase
MEDADGYAACQSTEVSALEQYGPADACEAERTELARELHDTVIQPLTSLVLSFTCFEQQPPPSTDHMMDHLKLWKGLAQETLDSLRAALAGVQQLVDGGRGLPEALHRSLTSQLSSRGLHLIIESHSWPVGLPLDWNRNLYLAVREAITNVEKHAAASVVNVRLHAQADGLVIRVVDNGVGLRHDDLAAPRFAPPGHRFGVGGIRDRLSLLGGRLEIADAPGGGALLEMWLPHPQQAGVGTSCASTVSGH